MKIGIVCYPTLGGSGIVATEIGLELARRGHEIHVIASETPWRFTNSDGNMLFHRVPEHTAPGETYTLSLAATIAQLAPQLDLLHVHYAVPHAAAALLGLQSSDGRKPKLVNTLHGTDVTRALAPTLRYCLEQSDGITVPSRYLQRAAQQAFAFTQPIEVIANFIDTKRFMPGTDSAENNDSPILLHASNFRAVKRVADVIAVFAEVRRQRVCRLWLAGDGDDRKAVEQLAKPFRDDITFLGARHDMAALLQTARVFIQTSEQEAFGLAALEAQSAGLPVVGTDVGGVSEVVVDQRTGFLAPVGDIATMAKAVLRLLDDEALRVQMSRTAREHAVEHFERKQQVDAYERYFSSLVSTL